MNARLTRASAHNKFGSILLVLVPIASFAACREVRMVEPLQPAPASQPPVAPAATRTPQWIGEPLSWAKLSEIEAWLATEGPSAEPFWRVEGELALSQGRVDLARADKTGQKASDASSRSRIHASRAGFQRVITDGEATPDQKKRAEAAIALCDRVLGTAAAEPRTAALPIIPRSQWGAMAASTSHMDKNRGGWRRITVHHSAERVPPELDGTIAESAAAVRSIQKAHMEGKETGYGDIGYHFVIDPYGNIFQGRDLAWQGAHAGGANNVQNIGVCLIGNFDEEKPTKAALDRLRRLIDNLRSTWKIQKSQVFTHQELKSTECPGRNLARWVEAYRRTAAAPVEATARAN